MASTLSWMFATKIHAINASGMHASSELTEFGKPISEFRLWPVCLWRGRTTEIGLAESLRFGSPPLFPGPQPLRGRGACQGFTARTFLWPLTRNNSFSNPGHHRDLNLGIVKQIEIMQVKAKNSLSRGKK